MFDAAPLALSLLSMFLWYVLTDCFGYIKA